MLKYISHHTNSSTKTAVTTRFIKAEHYISEALTVGHDRELGSRVWEREGWQRM